MKVSVGSAVHFKKGMLGMQELSSRKDPSSHPVLLNFYISTGDFKDTHKHTSGGNSSVHFLWFPLRLGGTGDLSGILSPPTVVAGPTIYLKEEAIVVGSQSETKEYPGVFCCQSHARAPPRVHCYSAWAWRGSWSIPDPECLLASTAVKARK